MYSTTLPYVVLIILYMKNNINNNYNVLMEKTQFNKRQERQPEKILRNEKQNQKEKNNTLKNFMKFFFSA